MIDMYLGANSGGWAVDGHQQAWATHTDPALALAHWTQDIASRTTRRWHKPRIALWLSGGLARPFLCGPVAGLTTWAEADVMAAAVAAEATGFEVDCEVRLEGWPGGGPVLGTAIESSITNAIAEAAARSHIAWASVRPRWAAAIDEALVQQPVLCLLALAEEDAFTVIGSASRPGSAQSPADFDLAATYAPAPTGDRALAIWRRTMLSRDVRPDTASFASLEPTQPADAGASSPQAGAKAPWPRVVLRLEVGEA